MVRVLACETDGRGSNPRPCLKTFNLNFKIQLCPNRNNNNNNNNNSHHLLGLRFAAAKNVQKQEKIFLLYCVHQQKYLNTVQL